MTERQRHVKPGLPTRLPSLTGVRVVLFCIVFFTHAVGGAGFFKDASVERLATVAPTAIGSLSMFFVISGFVLTWQQPWKVPFGAFVRKRTLKVFPSHVAAWAITMILVGTLGPLTLIGPTSAGPATANLLLVQSWIPSPDYVFSVYGTNWSVPGEILCYLVLPLVIRPMLWIPARHLWRWLAGLMLVLAIVPEIVGTTVGGPPWGIWAPLSFWQVYWSFFCPVTKLPEFMLGVVLARMVQTGAWPPIPARWAWRATIGLGLMVNHVLPRIYTSSDVMAIAVCLFVPILAMRDITGQSRVLNRRSLVVFGDVTYAAYLIQVPVLALAKALIGETTKFSVGAGALLMFGLFLVNVLVAWLIYRYVEKPVLRRLSRSSRPANPQPTQEGT